MNTQEMFNTMVKGLASQNWERSRNEWACLYRDNHCRKCAVGWLIPDEKYASWMEGVRGFSVLASIGWQFTDEERDFVLTAQTMHDSNDGDALQEKFRQLGQKFGLTLPEELSA